MIRLTLVSDPTKEFPENTSSEFKVRLAQPLTLPGEGWHVTLAAISTPDASPDKTVIFQFEKSAHLANMASEKR